MNFTLTQLQYIVAVERARNFRAAAKSCHVTQPTLSMQVLKLEDVLGIQIFDRSTQPVTVTPIGQKILEQSRIVLNQASLISELISQARAEVVGELRLGVIPTLAPYLLPLFLRDLANKHPKINLTVEEAKTDDIIVKLEKNQLDIGLLVTPLNHPAILERPLFEEPFYVYATKDSDLSKLNFVDDKLLSQHQLLLLSEGHCMREQMMRICRLKNRQSHQTKTDSLQFESSSIETLCRLVETGLGYTVVPHLATSGSKLPMGKIIPFSPPIPIREVSLVTHRSFVRDTILKALSNTITENLPKNLLTSKQTRLVPI